MKSMVLIFFLLFLSFTVSSSSQVFEDLQFKDVQYFSESILVSPFSIALKTLQDRINYSFGNVRLLGRAMTHASFSEENNKAFSILGLGVIEVSVTLELLNRNIDATAKDLNGKLSELSNVEASCAMDGMRLGLEKVIRVSRKTNSSAPAVVCGAFRAIFGAVALDSNSLDKAQTVYLGILKGSTGKTMATQITRRMSTYMRAYAPVVSPLNGPSLWPRTGITGPQPPRSRKLPGRHKKLRRVDFDEHEPPREDATVPQGKPGLKCSKCKQPGHNARLCEKGDANGEGTSVQAANVNKCSYCKELGHNKRGCVVRKEDLKKQAEAEAENEQTFEMELEQTMQEVELTSESQSVVDNEPAVEDLHEVFHTQNSHAETLTNEDPKELQNAWRKAGKYVVGRGSSSRANA